MTETDDVHPLVADWQIVITPGVYDVLSAKLAAQAGFPAAVLTGYGVAATYLGEPDFGLLTQTEILDVARRIRTQVPDLALVVDGDTGYGGPLNVQRMVRELVVMGANGLILEEQRWPKRCGHMRDKAVIDAEEHAAKIRAAVDAKADADLAIIARTDALETDGIDEALRRAKLYKDAGANVLFGEGLRTREELEIVGRELEGPLAVNLIEGGKTPVPSAQELHDLGFFSIGFVLSGLYSAAHALERTYRHIRAHASTDDLQDDMFAFDEFNRRIGLEARYAQDERYRT
ncbi:MAG: oxaloacetate decarboxylase [Nitriliruptorales bacterium]|nr:oxaloacetate decarboxylase [Nitriliruptorales bacterium]